MVDDLEIAQAVAEATFGMRPEVLDTDEIRAKVEARPNQERPQRTLPHTRRRSD